MARHEVGPTTVLWAINYCHSRGSYAFGDGLNLIVTHWQDLNTGDQQTIRGYLAEVPPALVHGYERRWSQIIRLTLTSTDEQDQPRPARFHEVDSSTIIWATRNCLGSTDPAIFTGGLDLILTHWDELSNKDQHVLSRDLFGRPTAVPKGAEDNWARVTQVAARPAPYFP